MHSTVGPIHGKASKISGTFIVLQITAIPPTQTTLQRTSIVGFISNQCQEMLRGRHKEANKCQCHQVGASNCYDVVYFLKMVVLFFIAPCKSGFQGSCSC